MQFLPMIFIFVIFYFLLIAPMRKKQKRRRRCSRSSRKATRSSRAAASSGGSRRFDEERGVVILQISDNMKIKVLRSAIAGLAGEPEATTARQRLRRSSAAFQLSPSLAPAAAGAAAEADSREPAPVDSARSFFRRSLGQEASLAVLLDPAGRGGRHRRLRLDGLRARARREWSGAAIPPLKDALKKAIKLGLDLRGGIHLVLQVNTADAVKAERDDAAEHAPDARRGSRPDARPGRVPDGPVVHGRRSPRRPTSAKLDDTVKRFLPDWALLRRPAASGSSR